MRVPPHAEPFTAKRGPSGVLLCHGFTGSPAALHPWAIHLAEDGLSVSVPRLPGHGTRWQDLARTEWDDWYTAAERALLRLREHCSTVAVGGLSAGGALALRLAQRHTDLVQGIVLVNPAVTSARRTLRLLPLLHRLRPTVPGIGNDIAKPGADEGCYDQTPLAALNSLTHGWRRVVSALPKVTQPLLMFRSVHDHVVDGTSTRTIRSGVSSADVDERVLVSSYHVATLDYDAPTIFRATVEFAHQHASRP